MESVNLLYNFIVILMAIVIFCLKITAPNAVLEFVLKTLGKLAPVFCIMYAGVQIFKHYGII